MNPGPRRKCSVLEFHIGLMEQLFAFENGSWVAHPERFFAIPDIAKHMGDFIGALHAGTPEAVPPPPVGGPEGDIPYGDTSRHEFNATTKEVTSWSFRVPVMPSGGWPGPNGSLLRLSIATFGGTDVLRRTCVSLTKGKLDDALFSQGKETPIAFHCGVELPEGVLAYINTIALEEPPVGAEKSSVSILWPPLVYP